MPLDVVVGPPGPGRAERVFEEARNAARDGSAALLVFPSARDASKARAQLAAEVTVGVRVATLDGALEREWALRGDGRGLVGHLQRNLLARRALIAAGISEAPGRGAVALLGALAQRQAAAGADVGIRRHGLAGTILDALRAYRSSLIDARLIEPAEAARALAEGPPLADVIGLVGFLALRPEHETLVRSWSRSAHVLVELPWTEGCGATSVLTPTIQRLEADGGRIITVASPLEGRHPEMRRVAASLFSGAAPAAGEGAVRFGVARGDEGEASLIAEVVSDVLAAGVDPADVVVAFPDPARHAGWVAHALRERGISSCSDASVGAGATPFGRALLRLWAWAQNPTSGADLAAFARSPFSGVDARSADEIDMAVRRDGGRAASSRAGRARRLLSMMGDVASRPVTGATARKWKELADELLHNAYPGDAPVLREDAGVDAAAHRALCGLVEDAAGLGDTAVVTAGELIAEYAIQAVRSHAGPAAGAVLVTSLARLAGERPQHAVIGGLTASEVPGRGDGERLEGGAVRGVMAALGISPEPGTDAARDRLTFYLAAAAPDRSLMLTRRETDDEGRALRESLYWDEFLDLYRSPGEEAWPASLADPCRPLVEGTPRAGAARVDRGAVRDRRALEELAGLGAVSPSQIERYLSCPYRWFVERQLRPETPDVAFDAREAGSLAHEALSEFYGRFAEVGERVTPASLPGALELVRQCLDEAARRAPEATTLDERRMLADVRPAVERMVAQDATFLPEFVPARHEWSFGLGDGDQPIDLDGLLLKGRADRIDVGPEGLVVIDYKLSKVTPVARFAQDGLVQLQLYAAAASRAIGEPVAGGLYRSLKSGKARGFVLDTVDGAFSRSDRMGTDDVDELIATTIETAKGAVDGMRSGRIEPQPDKQRCSSCPAASFCTEAAV